MNKYQFSKKQIIKHVKVFAEEFKKHTIDNYKTFSHGRDIPSIQQVRLQLGKWSVIKQEIIQKPVFCENCGIGRCRFNNNLNDCIYYEEA